MNSEQTSSRTAARHLIKVWFQYGGGKEVGGKIVLPHQCMAAGEDAGAWLVEQGFAVDDGWQMILTEAGVELLNSESE